MAEMSTIPNTNIIPVKQRFILPEKTKKLLSDKVPNFGFNGLGEVVFRRTYSRGNEDWKDVVIRVIEGVFSIRKEHYFRNSLDWDNTQAEIDASEMAFSMFDMEWLPPGRGLWMMGTDFVYERGSMALYNCAATDTKYDLVHSAEWAMDCLMNGVGVGFSTDWRGEAKMPDKKDTMTFVIPDSREGWVESLVKLLCSYVHSKKYGTNKFPVFDYSKIRPAGLPIKGFGGSASGPDPLKKMHERIESYLDSFCKGRLEICSDTMCQIKKYSHERLIADIFNAIGACVVAGNVRRSAEIALGNVDSQEFINLKNYELNPERMEIGWMSNNSVVLHERSDFEDFSYIPDLAKRIRDNGEPGIINLYNIQKYGRYGKEMKDDATLVNPCGEIPLSTGNNGGGEVCNLAEVFPPRCATPERFYKALEHATFYSSTVSLLPTHRPETNAIVAKNRRIGIGIGGIAQWLSSEEKGWATMDYTKMTFYLRHAYKIVRETNRVLAEKAGVPPSIRVTTVKPSGTISLLAGCTPGVHYPVSRFAIRRMRIGKDSPLVKPLIEAGIPHEKDTYSENTLVFEFVIDHGNVRPASEVSPWEQFSLVATLQRCYSDNCVSATVYFDKEKDAADIEKMLAMYIPVLKSVSMLPHSGHGYAQAPYEPITEEVYRERLAKYSQPKFSKVKNNIPVGSKYCTNDYCEI